MKSAWFYLPGRLYDAVLGLPLRGVRRKVAAWIARENLLPCLDVCCGTGSQFRAYQGDVRSAGIGLDLHPGMLRYAAARTPGSLFVLGDARGMPFRNGIFRGVTISFGLHEKTTEDRMAIVKEVRRVMRPDGMLICVDFENPWSRTSRFGAFWVDRIEGMAGGDHFRNSRRFLEQGGLRAFLREAGLMEIARRDVETGSLSIVAAVFSKGPGTARSL